MTPSAWNTIGNIGVVAAFGIGIAGALLDLVFGVPLKGWLSAYISAVVGGVVMTFAGFVMRDRADDALHRELRETGTPALARVLEVRQKDVINHVTQRLELLLDVQPEGRPPFRAKTYAYVPAHNAKAFFAPGSTVRVLFDPRKPSRLVVE